MIKTKTFILYIDPETGQFDEEAMLGFQAGREILEVARELLNIGGMPAWAMMLSYRDRPPPGSGAQGWGGHPSAGRSSKVVIPAADKALYDALRAWRLKHAEQIGKPVYSLLTNRQLAAIVAKRPKDLGELRSLPGIGEARSKQYGEALLEIIRTFDEHNAQVAKETQ